jgi:DNA gyrase subunit A
LEDPSRSSIPIDIEHEMRSSYLDYSMSVIIGRALPDVRDGLKPVHRRILYAMHDEGMRANKRYSKCAGVVGEVLKKYHPHGDSAVYDALVRMAQPWNMRSPLVDGQGNFGSVDGDPAAAYRYTECRMTPLAEVLLENIEEDTVSFQPNFDGATDEPTVMPAAFPNLLVNGSEGIAVGMATKIPPHNLAEIIDATLAVMANPELTLPELMRIVPGPDFPTAGTIYGRAGVRDAYATGRGRIVVRGEAHFEEIGNREAIIIDELPFQVNKARLVEEIANLVKEKRLDGISALRDESDRSGMRIVIELKRDAVREVVLNHLFKHTNLQTTFGVILLSIVHNRPAVLSLKEMLEHYIQHRRDVTIRRTRFRLRKAEARQHLVEGLLIALDNLDEVIRIIRSSENDEVAQSRLVTRFSLSATQAEAILNMRLRRLTALNRLELENERDELGRLIDGYREILASDGRLLEVIRTELLLVREKHADPRRTRFMESTGEVSVMDLIAEEDQVITMSMSGYIKRCAQTEFGVQVRGGMGKRGMRTRDQDSVRDIFIANTHSDLLVFTTQGLVYKLPVHKVPEVGRDARGIPIVNLLELDGGDRLAAVIPIADMGDDDVDLLFCSKKGLVKRTALSEFRNLRTNGLRAYDNADGDELFTVVRSTVEQQVFIATRNGMCIRFPGTNETGELEVRRMGRVARGVRGIDLADTDEIVSMMVIDDDPETRLLTVTVGGRGKRTVLSDYRVQSRGGKGIICMKPAEGKEDYVAGVVQVRDSDLVMVVTDGGQVLKTKVSTINEYSRASHGVKVMKLAEGERVVSIARAAEPEEAERDAEAERDPEADGDPGVGLSAVDEAETAAHLLDQDPALDQDPSAAGDDDSDPDGDEEAPTVRR